MSYRLLRTNLCYLLHAHETPNKKCMGNFVQLHCLGPINFGESDFFQYYWMLPIPITPGELLNRLEDELYTIMQGTCFQLQPYNSTQLYEQIQYQYRKPITNLLNLSPPQPPCGGWGYKCPQHHFISTLQLHLSVLLTPVIIL